MRDIAITPRDLRAALLRRVQFADLEARLQRQLRLPAAARTASSPLFLLQQLSPELAELLAQLMAGQSVRETKKGPARQYLQAPFCPRGIPLSQYLQPLIKKVRPSLIAVDASPAEVGAALHYGCSLAYGLHLPVTVALMAESTAQEQVSFQPGDCLPELALYCFQNRIPLFPLAAPPRLVPSEHQYTYNQLLQNAYLEFVHESRRTLPAEKLERLAAGLMQQVFNTGIHFVMEREDLIHQSCYLASRLQDLGRYLAARRLAGRPVLALYKMKHALDCPSLFKTFREQPAAAAELYWPPEPLPEGSFELEAVEPDQRPEPGVTPSKHAEKAGEALERILAARMNEPLTLDEVDRIASATLLALRSHPLVERPSGVRGTLATREIAQAYGLMHGRITRRALAQAAYIALRHRTRVREVEGAAIADVLKSIFSQEIYGLPLHPRADLTAAKPRRALTEKELAQALMGLSEASFLNLSPEDAMPLDDPAFAEQVMNHPLVQQALREAIEKGLLRDQQQAFRDLMHELEDRGFIDQASSSQMTLSKDGRQKLKESLEERLQRGELTPEQLADMLKHARTMPPPQGLTAEKMYLPPRAASELIAELMDFQHQGRSDSTSLEDLYVHYTINEKKGLKVSGHKVDYEKLKVILHQLEKKGVVKLSGEKSRFTLSHLSLEKLLEMMVRRQDSQILERRAFRREHETDKTEVRRYQRGDVFHDISTRHTIRRVIRKAKTLEDINHSDLRSFEKKPSNQLDIAVCVDISASMKEGGKLRYAKMAVAELAKAAIEKRDRVGIIAFSNLGEMVVSLTDKITPLLEATMTLRAEQYTNIGNGLACARKMLLKDRNSNPKYVILITDGEPNAALSDEYQGQDYHTQVAAFSRQTSMETKRAIGAHHALVEAAKTSRKHIKISVVFICPGKTEDTESERIAREIARIGGGRFHKVRAIERLPLEALATVA